MGRWRRSTRPRSRRVARRARRGWSVSPVRTTAIAAEDRPVEHHPVMPEPVGQDPEDRREDQLGEVERRARRGRRSSRRPASPPMLGELGEVDAEHRPGEAGAEAQRERAGQHGPQRTIHAPRSVAAPARGSDPARIMPATTRRPASGGGATREPRRDLHRFRVGPRPGRRRGSRDPHRPADRQLRRRRRSGPGST